MPCCRACPVINSASSFLASSLRGVGSYSSMAFSTMRWARSPSVRLPSSAHRERLALSMTADGK